MNDVFIGATATTIPPTFSSVTVADKFYPLHLCSERTNQLAKRVATGLRIKTRTVCLDLERIPEKVLSDRAHHPLSWCVELIQQLSKVVPTSEIGYVGVAYNTTLHTNSLPNLACQAAMRCGIVPEIAPEEFANNGCAGGFFPLNTAIQYCKRNEKAAIIIVFDQCTSRGSFCYDQNDPMFAMDLRVNLLFSDGAAAVLIIPERLKQPANGPLPKVEELSMLFRLSDIIRFEDTRFIIGQKIKDHVPQLVADSLIKPALSKHGLRPDDIAEWSVHQGGSEVLARFGEPEVLGLSTRQLERSNQLFECFGNMSAPSCFFVLDDFFREARDDKSGRFGMLVGFGAGFYLGSLLYRWT